MKRLLLLILLISSSSHVFSQQVCKGTDCKGLVKGDVLVSLDEVEASLFCNNELPIVPSELSGFTCRYNGNPITNPTFITSAIAPKVPPLKSNLDVNALPKAWVIQVSSTKTSSTPPSSTRRLAPAKDCRTGARRTLVLCKTPQTRLRV